MKVQVRRLLLIILSGSCLWGICRLYCKKIEDRARQGDKIRAISELFLKWNQNNKDGRTIERRLDEIGISTVAIYGMGDVGQRLYKELKDTDIEVKYAIDRRKIDIDEIQVISIDDELPEVDLIIVTAICDFPEIAGLLMTKTRCKVISFEEIVYGL